MFAKSLLVLACSALVHQASAARNGNGPSQNAPSKNAPSQSASSIQSAPAKATSTTAKSAPASTTAAKNAVASVSGTPEGFAADVTGGGSAEAVYPTTTDELISYLGDDEARVIVLSQTFDFTGTEGTTTATGCAPWGTGTGCQTAINANDWCDSSYPTVEVTYDNAGIEGITVASDKTIIGEGTSGVMIGKGLRIANGAQNVIIQNIKIDNLNPQYVWGGDAITLAGTDLVWIDHVTTSNIGRQHLVLGTTASNRVTVTNCEFDGQTDYSPSCDGYHYWNALFLGSDDQITLKNNYFHHFSGRAPKVGGTSLVHAVNNYFTDSDSSGHAFEIDEGGSVLAEGNVFDSVGTVVASGATGEALAVTSSNAAECQSALGRSCEANSFTSSGTFDMSDTDFLTGFSGADIATAEAASSVTFNSAGFGNI